MTAPAALCVLVTRRLSIDPLPFLRARLGEGCAVELHDSENPIPRADLLARAASADAIVATLSDRIDEELLNRAPRLRVVANHAVGVDNIDLRACVARGVRATNTPDVLTDATADLAFALLLAVARRLREGERMIREGRFTGWAPTMLLGLELRGALLGIFGFGRIGQAMARRALGFGMRVAWSRREGTSAAGPRIPADLQTKVSELSFDEMLAQADAISLHAPLDASTRHAFSAAQLARMKRGALLINTARGPLVDEAALAAALAAGQLGGAGLDVFEHEPKVHPALLSRDDVVLVPHLGSATVAARRAMAETAMAEAARVLLGQEPLHPVSPADR
ncbi:MAG TPA: D-glycerate dehydrogenase [Myxococcales bacterium]|jgi:glyoxylate reductase|nr:D-glycerate dehydrogenase [Myxococcales bacterium]